MNESWAQVLLALVGGYAVVGVLFAVWFAAVGVGRIDPVAREGTWGFRLAIVPGAAALWPLLVSRLVQGTSQPPVERNAHRAAARRGGT